jgi:Tol biopolymer transport system component/predicted Ser/Thr protein kinase
MGEVYKARDTRLDRTVAIKISQENFSERFEREARAVAALNHPNICALYDVGPNYLVMEFVEGVPLQGPLPLEKAIDYAGQILEALDHAHRKGITHRDLKPANILVTKSGIKLLDFGLAKMKPSPLKETDETLTRALTKPLTQGGQILGTLQYMSPEQLQGKDADARADLFSFGCVLYEMLTGKRAFDGSSAASVIAAILERPAPTVADVAPPALDRVLKRCLEKDPDRRWQNALDLKSAMELSAALSGVGDSGAAFQAAAGLRPGSSAPSRSRFRAGGWIAAGVLVIALAGTSLVAYRHTTEPPPQVVKTSIEPPSGAVFSGAPAISPNGRHVAFDAMEGTRRQLWIRDMDSMEARPIPGTDDALRPFWSPDSRSVGFFANRKLKTVDIFGGPVVTLCDVGPQERGASWSKNNVILFTLNITGPLFRVPASGGKPEAATTLDEKSGEITHRFPWFLPDGRHYLYVAAKRNLENAAVYLGDLETRERRRVTDTQSNVAYAPPGFLLFTRDQALFAQSMNADSGALSGTPVPLAASIRFLRNQIEGSFSASQNGVIVYRPGGGISDPPLTWFKRDGTRIGDLSAAGLHPSLSPDESAVAFDRSNPQTNVTDNTDIWLFKIASQQTARLTLNGRGNRNPIWSPDGRQVAYRTSAGGGAGANRMSVDGATPAVVVDPGDRNSQISDWTPDGKYIVEHGNGAGAAVAEIWLAPVLEPGKPRPLLHANFSQAMGMVSPDGRWIAYIANETGRFEIYVQAFPDGSAKRQVSTQGGTSPRWSKKGDELFFLSPDEKMMAASVGKGPTLEIGAPKALFSVRVAGGVYDVSKDGRFLIPVESEQPTQPPLAVVLNWPAGLKK